MERPVRAFWRAVAAGTVVGGAPVACVTIPLGIALYLEPLTGDSSLLASLYLAILPFLVAFALVLAGSALIGLPAHLFFCRYKIARGKAYVIGGAATGFLVSLAVLIVMGGEVQLWICLLGAFSGFVTALSWSKSVEDSQRSGSG
jgi:hypothetical protein